jgi:hypothetical protein
LRKSPGFHDISKAKLSNSLKRLFDRKQSLVDFFFSVDLLNKRFFKVCPAGASSRRRISETSTGSFCRVIGQHGAAVSSNSVQAQQNFVFEAPASAGPRKQRLSKGRFGLYNAPFRNRHATVLGGVTIARAKLTYAADTSSNVTAANKYGDTGSGPAFRGNARRGDVPRRAATVRAGEPAQPVAARPTGWPLAGAESPRGRLLKEKRRAWTRSGHVLRRPAAS